MEGMCVKFDVIGLDSPCVDLAVNVRCFPKPNGAERIQNLSWQGGGKVASGSSGKIGALLWNNGKCWR